jgi:hypothetical protein
VVYIWIREYVEVETVKDLSCLDGLSSINMSCCIKVFIVFLSSIQSGALDLNIVKLGRILVHIKA